MSLRPTEFALEGLPPPRKYDAWLDEHGSEGLLELARIMQETYEVPPWRWHTPLDRVQQTLEELRDRDADIVPIFHEGRIVSYGIGLPFEACSLRDALAAAGAPTERAYYIDTISTIRPFQGNGCMKYVFAALQLLASERDWLISWTSQSNYDHLAKYFRNTGRTVVGTFQPERFWERAVVLVKNLKEHRRV